MLPTGRTALEERLKTEARAEQIANKGLDLTAVWTCQIQKMLEKDKEMREFFDSCVDTGPINLRDAYYGGMLIFKKYTKKPYFFKNRPHGTSETFC